MPIQGGLQRGTTHVLFACDAFKGTLASYRVGEAAERGIRRAVQEHLSKNAAADGAADVSSNGCNTRNNGSADCASTSTTGSASSTSLLFMSGAPSTSHGGHGVESNGHNELAAVMPFAFHHCPMSDGGAGLLDSLTYRSSDSANENSKRNIESLGSDTRLVANSLSRVYIPASTPITGPLGTPLHAFHTATAAVNTSDHKSMNATICSQDTMCASFACDVAGRVVVVEMADASGLPRVPTPAQRNPLYTTSYGTGEVLRYAMKHMEREIRRSLIPSQFRSHEGEGKSDSEGSDEQEERAGPVGVSLYLGIGGSATNDGGLGALQGLGVVDIYVKKAEGRVASTGTGIASDDGTEAEEKLARPFRGGDLARITRLALTPELYRLFLPEYSPAPHISNDATRHYHGNIACDGEALCHVYIREVFLICDVDNPLVGPRGATYAFGPQKCAPNMETNTQGSTGHGQGMCGAKAATTPPAKKQRSEEMPSTQDAAIDDGDVGVVRSQQQQAVLDELERGMSHAAERVVASTYASLCAFRTRRGAAFAASTAAAGALRRRDGSMPCMSAEKKTDDHAEKMAQTSRDRSRHITEDMKTEAACLDELLHGSGGGGAGGMSGFVRYLLGATRLPGTDAVADLLGLSHRNTPPVATQNGPPGSTARHTCTTAAARNSHRSDTQSESAFHGLLYTHCDVLVTGEGSFDAQTIYSHKTVGRLLEMAVEANVRALARNTTAATSLSATSAPAPSLATWRRAGRIDEIVILCGRCGFANNAECQRKVQLALVETLLPKRFLSASPSKATGEMHAPPSLNAYEPFTGECHRGKGATEHERDVAWGRLLASCCPSEGTSTFAENSTDQNSLTASAQLTETLMQLIIKATPRVTVLPLSPSPFTVHNAMTEPYRCVETRLRDYCVDGACAASCTPEQSHM